MLFVTVGAADEPDDEGSDLLIVLEGV